MSRLTLRSMQLSRRQVSLLFSRLCVFGFKFMYVCLVVCAVFIKGNKTKSEYDMMSEE